jgi:hypothetical protein
MHLGCILDATEHGVCLEYNARRGERLNANHTVARMSTVLNIVKAPPYISHTLPRPTPTHPLKNRKSPQVTPAYKIKRSVIPLSSTGSSAVINYTYIFLLSTLDPTIPLLFPSHLNMQNLTRPNRPNKQTNNLNQNDHIYNSTLLQRSPK